MRRERVGIHSAAEAEALTGFFVKGRSRGRMGWRKGEVLVRYRSWAMTHDHFWLIWR